MINSNHQSHTGLKSSNIRSPSPQVTPDESSDVRDVWDMKVLLSHFSHRLNEYRHR